MSEKSSRILLHVIGCVFFMSLPVFFSPDLSATFDFIHIPGFQRDFLLNILLLGFFYLSYFVFIPKWYFEKKYLSFILIHILSFAIIIYLPNLIIGEKHFGPPMGEGIGPAPPHQFKWPILRDIYRNIFRFLIVSVIPLFLSIYSRWKQSEKERVNAELAYLKAQINPHFLFNTLNSIYSLAIVKSDTTAEAVVKLSGMMRYILSESHNEFVSLEKEIAYISDYISLQKIRLDDTVTLEFSLNGSVFGKKIAPLLLIPFIENAFKYGVNPEENSYISIKLEIEEQVLRLLVKNNIVHTNIGENLKSGLGIKNTEKRLQLLYPGEHELIINQDQKQFTVSLSIKL